MAQHMTFLKYPRVRLMVGNGERASVRIIAADVTDTEPVGQITNHLEFKTTHVYVHEADCIMHGMAARVPLKTTMSVKLDEILSCCGERGASDA